MSTIPVLDANGDPVDIEKPLTPGRAAAAASRPIALSTEDKAALDALATQTTAAAILAKIIVAPATEAKQDALILANHTDLVALATLLSAIGSLLTTQAAYLDGIEGNQSTLNAKDFATQTTLAAVLAKIIAAPATEAKQDALITANHTDLAAILAKIIAAPATEAKQDALITANHTDLAAIATLLTTQAGYLDGLEGFVDGLEGVLGTAAGAAVITDANGTIQQYLRGLIVQWIAGTLKIAGGAVAHDGIDSGNPLKVGGRARSSEIAAVASDDRADFVTDLVGKQIVLPYANPENFVSGATAAMTGTTSTSLIAAPGAGLRNYITTIVVSNSHATVGTDLIIQDGSGGTTLLTIPAAAVYGGAVINLPVPLRQPTANTALFCANVTTGASVKVSAVGYKGA